MLCGYSPWEDPDETVEREVQDIINSIITAEFVFSPQDWGNVEDEAKDFIKQILVVEV
jgi:hypothetical protein